MAVIVELHNSNDIISVQELPKISSGQRLRIFGDTFQKALYIASGGTVTGPFVTGKKADVDIGWLGAFLGERAHLLVVDQRPRLRTASFPVKTVVQLNDGRSLPVAVNVSVRYTLRVTDPKALAEAAVAATVSDVVSELERMLTNAASSEIRAAFRQLQAVPFSFQDLSGLEDVVEDGLYRRVLRAIAGITVDDPHVSIDIENEEKLFEAINRDIEDQRAVRLKMADVAYQALLGYYKSAANVPGEVSKLVVAYLRANPGSGAVELNAALPVFEKLMAQFGADETVKMAQELVGQKNLLGGKK